MPPGPAGARGLECEHSGPSSGTGEAVSRGSGTHAGPGGPGQSPWCPGAPLTVLGPWSPADACLLHLPAGERAGPKQAPPSAENNPETPAGAEVTPSRPAPQPIPAISSAPSQVGPGQQAESQAWGGGCAPSEWGGRSVEDQPKGHRPSLEPCSAGCLQASHTPV